MNGYKKEGVKREMCKNHPARSDRDTFRVCPSKLSKKELEDLYFALFDKNIELKKTVTAQQDQLKVLSTKVQRMTATQKNNVAKEKDCCTYTKSMVIEQKECIDDLKRANERMSERIRVLNMRLCSAKQFLRRSPTTSTSRCTKCSAPPASLKNSSVSMLNKMSGSNVNTAVSGQGLDKDVMLSTRTVETGTDEPEKENPERLCNENRCRSLMEELKQKIVDLQEELSKTHSEYSTRITRIEAEVSELRTANDRERTERATSDHQLQIRDQQVEQLATRLRDAEAKYGELSTELSIEKHKVAELETRVKAADRASVVSKTIQEQLNNSHKKKTEVANQQSKPVGSPYIPPRFSKSSSPLQKKTEVTNQQSEPARSPYIPLRFDKSSSPPQKKTEVANQQSEPAGSPYIPSESPKMPAGSPHMPAGSSYIPAGSPNMPAGSVYMPSGSPNIPVGSPYISPRWDKSSSPVHEMQCETPGQPSEATDRPYTDKDKSTEKANQNRLSNLSNDSGYIEAYKSPKIADEKQKDSNEELNERIAKLQKQMNELLSAMRGDPVVCKEDGGNAPGEDTRSTSPPIQVSGFPVSDSEFGKTLESASVLKTESCIVKPESPDMMIFLDEASTTEAVSMNKAQRESLVSRDAVAFRDESKTQAEKDSHNRLQIPGPLPVGNMFKFPDKIYDKFKNKHKTTKNKKQGFDAKKSDGVEKPLRIQDDAETKPTSMGFKDTTPDDNDVKVERDTKVRISSAQSALDSYASAPAPVGIITEKYSGNEVDRGPTSSTIFPVNDHPDDVEGSKIELCLHHTRVCSCSGARRRDVAVFRSCSGTLRFRTAPAQSGAEFKRCGCAARSENTVSGDVAETCEQATQTNPAPELTDEFRPRSASKGLTYPIPAPVGNLHQAEAYTRPLSPDNTDHEISSLTDLPSEKDDKSPRDALSPGEEKATTTYTESFTPHTTTEYSTLSEGELPGAGGVRKLSDGETKLKIEDNTQAGEGKRQSARMEQALAAISEELALCHDMLHAKRASESPPDNKDESLMVDLCPGPIALKRAAGSPRIGDAFTPKCIFTLHIGTVVLSDEAVINSRDMSLVLTWKFYDQNMSMTRMRAGRVMLFDFSTEYDVKITDHFLNYLKHENMQLIISELDKQDEPFASCALPLRDALLHTNRRADMSLALMAGPYLRQTHDALDSGDEVGVLDLWCMLRVDPALLPAINRAIARSSPPNMSTKEPGTSAGMEQLIEDDRYNNDYDDASQDHSIKQKTDLYDFQLPKNQNMNQRTGIYEFEVPKRSSKRKIELYDMISDIAFRRSIASQISSPTTPTSTQPPQKNRASFLQRNQVGFKDADTQSIHSRIIVNEVPAQIKSAYDMKQALDRNAEHENIPPITRLAKIDDDAVSQTHSGRGLVTRRQIPKSAKKGSFCKKECSMTSLVKKERHKPSKGVQAHLPPSDVEEPPELTRSSRFQNGSKKSVTIAQYNENVDWDKETWLSQKPPTYNHCPIDNPISQSVEITVMWLALNEECDAMVNPNVQRLYVAYTFLDRSGADLETPVSLPKPKSYVDKCYFQFSKKFQLNDCDLPLLGHMARSRSANRTEHSPKDCVIFTVISEPPEDPLGLDNCEDIGHAYLYFGDVLAYSAGNDSYIEVVPVQSVQPQETVCGVLAVKVDGLDVLRRCTLLATASRDLPLNMY